MVKKLQQKRGINGTIASTMLAVVVIIGVTVISWYWTKLQSLRKENGEVQETASRSPSLSPTPTPTPIILPKGKGTFTVSQGSHEGPTFTKISLNPIDAKKGQSTTLTVQLTNPSPVSEVIGTLESDNHTKTPFTMKNTATQGVSTTWETTLDITDTLWYTYTVTLEAKATNGTSTNTVMPR